MNLICSFYEFTVDVSLIYLPIHYSLFMVPSSVCYILLDFDAIVRHLRGSSLLQLYRSL